MKKTFEERAEEVLKDREVWGNAWDDYDDVTLIDIILGKVQRAWNLTEKIREDTKTDPRGLDYSDIQKIEDCHIDIHNYGNYFKKRLKQRR